MFNRWALHNVIKKTRQLQRSLSCSSFPLAHTRALACICECILHIRGARRPPFGGDGHHGGGSKNESLAHALNYPKSKHSHCSVWRPRERERDDGTHTAPIAAPRSTRSKLMHTHSPGHYITRLHREIIYSMDHIKPLCTRDHLTVVLLPRASFFPSDSATSLCVCLCRHRRCAAVRLIAKRNE